jgi:trehalose 6-phosphate synthase/phosphatase
VRVDTFPLGIDYARFRDAAAAAETREEMETLWKTPSGMRIISSVDRLDYTKGLLHRLRGFEHFLTTHPEWMGKVQLILIVVPSREEVDQYQKMKKELDETVGQVNGALGNPQWTPVIYQYRSLTFHSLVALYARTDIALITPLRDGMNLVAKEFVASKGGGTGVLILSEMAGAAQELGEALIVNPNHKAEIGEAIFQALTMPETEQQERLAAMRSRLIRNDAKHWSEGFFAAWKDTRALRERLLAKHLAPEPRRNLLAHYQVADAKLVLLDYDGTLVPFASRPEKATPDPKLRQLLRRLASFPSNRVYLVSGREREILDRWFGDLGVGMIAEHGVWLREPGEEWNLTKPLDRSWKQKLSPILSGYVDRLSGSFVEEKEYSLAWHYRGCNPEWANYRAKELVDMLTHFTANMDVQVLEGKKVVEIRCAGVNKGLAATHCLEKWRPDFVLAIGDDATDEDLFRAMPETAHTIRVGMAASFADYNLKDYVEVRTLLAEMSAETFGPKVKVP